MNSNIINKIIFYISEIEKIVFVNESEKIIIIDKISKYYNYEKFQRRLNNIEIGTWIKLPSDGYPIKYYHRETYKNMSNIDNLNWYYLDDLQSSEFDNLDNLDKCKDLIPHINNKQVIICNEEKSGNINKFDIINNNEASHIILGYGYNYNYDDYSDIFNDSDSDSTKIDYGSDSSDCATEKRINKHARKTGKIQSIIIGGNIMECSCDCKINCSYFGSMKYNEIKYICIDCSKNFNIKYNNYDSFDICEECWNDVEHQDFVDYYKINDDEIDHNKNHKFKKIKNYSIII